MSDLNLKPLLKEVKKSDIEYNKIKKYGKIRTIEWKYDCRRLSSNEIKTEINFTLFCSKNKGSLLLNVYFCLFDSTLNQKIKTQMDETFYSLMGELGISLTLAGQILEIDKLENLFIYSIDLDLESVNFSQILESEIYLKNGLDLSRINNLGKDFFVKYMDKNEELLNLIDNKNGRTEKEILDLIELNYKL